jgi:hypothetical protein
MHAATATVPAAPPAALCKRWQCARGGAYLRGRTGPHRHDCTVAAECEQLTSECYGAVDCSYACTSVAESAVYFQCTILRQVVVVMGAGIGKSVKYRSESPTAVYHLLLPAPHIARHCRQAQLRRMSHALHDIVVGWHALPAVTPPLTHISRMPLAAHAQT